MDITTALLHHVTELTDRRLAADLARSADQQAEPIGPRQQMVMIMNAACCWLNPGSAHHRGEGIVAAALDWTTRLAADLGSGGLFSIGGNTDSAPDTAFVINDAAATVLLLRSADALPRLRQTLGTIIDRTTAGLTGGGVHTPNHRWEVAAALARIDAVRSDPAARARARQWLAEGVDIDADGLYSERSANYAAYVSNPSLLALSELLDRPDLADAVHRNLHAEVELTGPDGIVETVFSRRQDQKLPDHSRGANGLRLGIFLWHYRHFAATCGRCAATFEALVERELAAAEPIADPTTVLAHLLPAASPRPDEGPELVEEPGASGEVRRVRLFTAARVAVVHDQQSMITLNAGSDVPAAGRIASGLACNPTFLRWRFADLAVDSVRLSRNFFGLGPFRAQRLDQPSDNLFRLEETVTADYYQPLPDDLRDDHGDYALQFEGRFAAQLAFTDRPSTQLALATRVDVELDPDRVVLRVSSTGPQTRQCLEFGFRPGGTMLGGRLLAAGDGRWLHSPGTGYQLGADRIAIDSDAPVGSAADAFYRPGEAYEFLQGSDGVGGPRLYLPFRTPGSLEITLTHSISGDRTD